jgi:hypothetical protein
MAGTVQSDVDGRSVLAAILLVPFWVAHTVWSAWLSHEFFRLSGGIVTEGRWTRYGGIDYSWTNLAWLPGGLMLPLGPVAPIGAFVMLAGSGFAAYLAAGCCVRGLSFDWRWFGKREWRLWLSLLLWFGWVPVPVESTLTYWCTVAY